ncbi:M20 family metallopeptidase [Fundicoccus culcitae]|uniref:Probable succinyl-diaminopimelate desuccinylase n=1 Tax=Fundicoccus culcitae TaxID=2969821 RepID=A0ABY5P4V0_9LACT|nr:ArgE/DapE family deacylase [Fundicoccus culcitae]UUX33405.1 ArgE/DapE family deacylase [Fundicoccus culcitae]
MTELTKTQLKQQVVQAIEDQQRDLLDLCSKLIQINSENPPGDSTEITEFIKTYLEEAGLAVEIHESAPLQYNIISKYGSESGKKLIYCGHTDVVPVGNLDKWDFDPFSGEIKDGFLLGRGASDMKAGLGGLIFATTLMKKLNISLPGQVILAIVPDEETGGENGVPWVLNKGLVSGDGALIAEPSSKYNPTIGQKGSYWFKLDVYGEPGHGSLSPIIGGNAIVDMMRAIERIQTLFTLDFDMPDEMRELVETSKRYMREVETEREAFQPILEHISCNIGKIEGGTKANVVPESCSVEIDCRLPFGVSEDFVTQYITDELDKLGIDYKMERFGFRSEANYTSPQDPVCRAVVDNLQEISGHEAYGVMQWASSDARHFREHNIPVLQYGPATLSTIHGYNERVEVDKIVLATKVYGAAIIDFLYN